MEYACWGQDRDTLSAMKFRMNKADTALRSELHFYKSTGVPEKKKHDRDRQVVQFCLLHTSESWRRTTWLGKPSLGDDWWKTMDWA